MAKSRAGKNKREKNPNKKKFQSQTFFKAAMRKPKDEEIEIYCRWHNSAVNVVRLKLKHNVLKLEKFWEKWNAMPEWVRKNLVNPDSLEGVRRMLYEDLQALPDPNINMRSAAAEQLQRAEREFLAPQARMSGGPSWRGVMGMSASDMANYSGDPTRNFISGESSMATAQRIANASLVEQWGRSPTLQDYARSITIDLNDLTRENEMATAQRMATPYNDTDIASVVGSNRNVGLVARHLSIDPNLLLDQVRTGSITRNEFAAALERVCRETGQALDPIPAATITASSAPQRPQAQPYQPGQNILDYVENQLETERDPERKKWLMAFKIAGATITASSAPQPPQAQPYQPGQKVMDYVEEQLKTERDPERKKWLMAFKLCILPESVRDVIEEAITVVLCKSKFDTWGFNETFEKGLTNSILIYGPPGTGKTMVTESIAAILGQKLLKLTTGDLQSQIPGEMERNIKHNFEEATEQKAVVMLDECDSLLYDRAQVGAILASEINALLGAIENFSGVVVLTTNRLGVLDPALQRRIIAKVKLDPPGLEERKQIWKNLIPKKMPLSECVNTEAYAEHALTGGEIKNAVLLAARRAIARNVDKVTHEHFEHGIATILEGKRDYEANRPKDIRELDYRKPKADIGVSMGASKDLIRGIDRGRDLIRERNSSCS